MSRRNRYGTLGAIALAGPALVCARLAVADCIGKTSLGYGCPSMCPGVEAGCGACHGGGCTTLRVLCNVKSGVANDGPYAFAAVVPTPCWESFVCQPENPYEGCDESNLCINTWIPVGQSTETFNDKVFGGECP